MARSRHTLRFPWGEAVPGIVLGLVIGAVVAVHFGRMLAGVTTSPIPFPDTWTYRYKGLSLLVIAVAGVAVAASGLVWRAERQFANYVILGGGLGVMSFGTSYLAFEKVEVTPNEVVYRSWWGLSRDELAFADLREFRVVHHRTWRRSRVSLHYLTHDGRDTLLCYRIGRYGVFFWSQVHLLQSARKAGIEVRQENEP